MRQSNGCKAALLAGIVALSLFLAMSSPVLSQEKLVSIDFNNVDIRVVARYVSELTGKNFVVAENVQGTVTIISPRMVSADEVYRIFQSVLDVNGFTTVKGDKVIKIVPKSGVVQQAIEVGKGPAPLPPGEQFVTRLIPINYADVETVHDVLAPLIAKESHLATYVPTNTLIVTDVASNIERLMEIISEVDVAGAEKQVEVVPIKHLTAREVAELIRSTLETGGGPRVRPAPGQPTGPEPQSYEVVGRGEQRVKLIPYDRTNSLIVVAPKKDLAAIRSLTMSLDVPATQPTGRINVYYLEYADAQEMATLLIDLVSKRRSVGGAVAGVPQGEEVIEVQGEIYVSADPSTNALVIMAAPSDYEALRGVIEKLDIRREQVYVEALIAEITYDQLQELGTQLFGAIEVGSVDIVGSNTFGNFLNLLAQPFPAGGGLVTSLFNTSETVTMPNGVEVPTQAAIFTALSTSSNVNVLSAPHLLTSDNQEAEIVVAENVPFITSSQQVTATGGLLTNVVRQDVGITLRIKPKITTSEYISLEIFEEIADVIPSPVGQNPDLVGPTTARKAAHSNVTVKDGQTIVIGGLLEDSSAATEVRTPCLGSLPLAGYLFKSRTDSVEKTNLVIFITPHIMRAQADLEKVREETERTRQELLDKVESGEVQLRSE